MAREKGVLFQDHPWWHTGLAYTTPVIFFVVNVGHICPSMDCLGMCLWQTFFHLTVRRHIEL